MEEISREKSLDNCWFVSGINKEKTPLKCLKFQGTNKKHNGLPELQKIH
jgi:hypothetical protein